MERQGVIYKIENLVNGKVYIGQTRVGFEKRKKQHIHELKNNIHNNDYMQKSWNKYGKENFKFSIVEECILDKLDELEVKWIAYYKNSVGVYNLDSGGNKNKKFSEYSLKKMSEASKKNWNNPKYSNRLRKIFANIHGGKNNINARKVICINTGEIFETLNEASKKYNINIQAISKVCTGKYISAGFHSNGIPLQFAYYEEGKIYKLKETNGLNEVKKVVLTNTGEVFESARKASEKYGLSQGSISSCCAGKIRSAGKLPNGEYSVWVYEIDYLQNKDYYFHRHKGSHNPRAKKIICLTTGEIFDTMVEAGKKYNISGNGCKISLACTGKRKYVGSLLDGTKLEWSYYEN